MKRVLCFLLCAVIIVCAAGCSAPLTEEEYCEKVIESFKQYNEASQACYNEMKNGGGDLSGLDRAGEYLNEMEKLSPPAEYKDSHKKLCEGIKTERELLSVIKDIFEVPESDDDEGTEVLIKSIERIDKIKNDNTFLDAIKEIADKYDMTAADS